VRVVGQAAGNGRAAGRGVGVERRIVARQWWWGGSGDSGRRCVDAVGVYRPGGQMGGGAAAVLGGLSAGRASNKRGRTGRPSTPSRIELQTLGLWRLPPGFRSRSNGTLYVPLSPWHGAAAGGEEGWEPVGQEEQEKVVSNKDRLAYQQNRDCGRGHVRDPGSDGRYTRACSIVHGRDGRFCFRLCFLAGVSATREAIARGATCPRGDARPLRQAALGLNAIPRRAQADGRSPRQSPTPRQAWQQPPAAAFPACHVGLCNWQKHWQVTLAKMAPGDRMSTTG